MFNEQNMQRYEQVWSSLWKKPAVINSAGWVWLFLRSTIQLHTRMPFTVLLQRYDSVLCQKTRPRQYNPAHAAVCLKDPTEFQCRDELHAQIWNCSTLEVFKEASLGFFTSLLVFCFNIFISLFSVSVYIYTLFFWQSP